MTDLHSGKNSFDATAIIPGLDETMDEYTKAHPTLKTIPFGRPFLIGKELEYVAQVASDNQLSGDCKFTLLCHQWFEQQMGVTKALLTHSCTAALELAAFAAEIGPGDEVIMPSYTFVSTANAFALRGAIPVFIDISENDLNMDVDLIEGAITDKTKAIVPVHYAGVGCDLDKIMQLAEKYNLVVIEDAAQGIYSKYHDRYLGTIGHFGCISFHETKNITSGEGGVLFINDKKYINKAEIVREKGTNRTEFFRGEVEKYTWKELGSSYLPGELIAAFLYGQLEKIDTVINARRDICKQYSNSLSKKLSAINIRTAQPLNRGEFNGHIFYLLCRDQEERDELIAYLQTLGISAVFHYVPLHSSPAGEKYCRVNSSMQVTNDVSARIVRLPVFYELKSEEIEYICDSVLSFFLS